MDARSRILFVSGSLGLGHVVRDLAIAREIRHLRPGATISWLAASPAREYLDAEGEQVIPESDRFADVTTVADRRAHDGEFNISLWALSVRGQWEANAHLYAELVEGGAYDLAIGDETYEIAMALKERPILGRTPFVILYDFVGLDRMSLNPMEAFGVYMFNRIWATAPKGYTVAFVGEPEDIPDRSFGPFLPNRRVFAAQHYRFVGYALQFDPADYADRAALRVRLGYGDGPLVIATVGGTGAGRLLLDLCIAAFPQARQAVPGLQLVLVGGPRVEAGGGGLPEGVIARGFVPRLYEHFAAADLTVTQAGGTTTLELTALGRPFLYFPIEGHCEQMIHVCERLARHKAGVRMSYRHTTPAMLADGIVAGLATKPQVQPMRLDGARRVAELACEMLERGASAAPAAPAAPAA